MSLFGGNKQVLVFSIRNETLYEQTPLLLLVRLSRLRDPSPSEIPKGSGEKDKLSVKNKASEDAPSSPRSVLAVVVEFASRLARLHGCFFPPKRRGTHEAVLPQLSSFVFYITQETPLPSVLRTGILKPPGEEAFCSGYSFLLGGLSFPP